MLLCLEIINHSMECHVFGKRTCLAALTHIQVAAHQKCSKVIFGYQKTLKDIHVNLIVSFLWEKTTDWSENFVTDHLIGPIYQSTTRSELLLNTSFIHYKVAYMYMLLKHQVDSGFIFRVRNLFIIFTSR